MWRQVGIVILVAGIAGLAELADQVAPATPVAPTPTNERERWAVDFLAGLGNTRPSADTLTFLAAWHQAEGGDATYNWLNTTQDAPGASCYNADPCVKNYPDYQTGVQATIETLRSDQPGYAEIVAGLQTNDPDRAIAGLYASPWGSSAVLVQEVQEERTPLRTGPSGRKFMVTPTMEVGAHFTTADCRWWSFQVGCQHWGTDLHGAQGTPVYAPFDLTIIALGEYGPGATMGQYVQGTFADGYVFYSGHLEGRQPMQVGETLPAGTLLGFTNKLAHTHIQLAGPGNTGPCAQDGSCVDFERYFEEH